MKKTIIILFALALGTASCSNNCSNNSTQKETTKPETSSISYDSYTNPRFGFSIMYPTFLSPQPESENGDGRVFSNGKNEEMSVLLRITFWTNPLKTYIKHVKTSMKELSPTPPKRTTGLWCPGQILRITISTERPY